MDNRSTASTAAPGTRKDDGTPAYYSISEAAALLGVSRVSIWRWVRAARLPVWRIGHRTIRVKREDVERLLVRQGPAGAGTENGRKQFRTAAVERGQAERELQAAVTQMAAIATENARLYGEAQEAVRLRDEFLSIASHELKTPLTSLLGHLQLLKRRLAGTGQIEPERVDKSLDIMTGQVQRLSRLLNQLLDVSRLEAGKLALERQTTDLTALVEQVVARARALTARHGITLRAPAGVQAWVDPLRLEQVLTNLLDNAIKYSPDGGPICVELNQRDGSVAELSVRDHGLGIPPERREQIFERFYQAHANGHRSGLGLGLYISRQIVEQHGGTLRAEFPPDGGTRFVVSVPLVSSMPSTDQRCDPEPLVVG